MKKNRLIKDSKISTEKINITLDLFEAFLKEPFSEENEELFKTALLTKLNLISMEKMKADEKRNEESSLSKQILHSYQQFSNLRKQQISDIDHIYKDIKSNTTESISLLDRFDQHFIEIPEDNLKLTQKYKKISNSNLDRRKKIYEIQNEIDILEKKMERLFEELRLLQKPEEEVAALKIDSLKEHHQKIQENQNDRKEILQNFQKQKALLEDIHTHAKEECEKISMSINKLREEQRKNKQEEKDALKKAQEKREKEQKALVEKAEKIKQEEALKASKKEQFKKNREKSLKKPQSPPQKLEAEEVKQKITKIIRNEKNPKLTPNDGSEKNIPSPSSSSIAADLMSTATPTQTLENLNIATEVSNNTILNSFNMSKSTETETLLPPEKNNSDEALYNDPIFLWDYANTLVELEEFKEAISEYEKALKSEPAFATNSRFIKDHAMALYKARQWKEALLKLNIALDLDQSLANDPQFAWNRACALLQCREAEKALLELKRIKILAPDLYRNKEFRMYLENAHHLSEQIKREGPRYKP